MTIKDASRITGLSQDTLRFYEKAGMIPAVQRTNGIRDYSEIDLRWISLAKSLRNAGLPVESVARYVSLYTAGDSTLTERMQLLSETRQTLLLQRKLLDETILRMDQLISGCRSAMELNQQKSRPFPDSYADHVRPEALRVEYPGDDDSEI
ncbi:MAG: MerR family transcriptional regulator [Clostridia bacterium]|nr:MerR family transcriptional regulator [Clostridia bacterium]MBQ8511598.1 MerR family transcriptional regulator [Clostridia bacterium]